MRIAVLGTGIAGRTLADAFAAHGNEVVVGTRDVAATAARPEVAEWVAAHPEIRLVPLAEAGSHGEVLVNATSGQGTLEAVGGADARGHLNGTVVLDVSNSLDFSRAPAAAVRREHRQPGRAAAADLPRGAGGEGAQHRQRRGHGRPRLRAW